MSCRKDDENNNNNDAVSITGTWKIVKTEIVSGKDKQKVLETKIPNDCEKNLHLNILQMASITFSSMIISTGHVI